MSAVVRDEHPLDKLSDPIQYEMFALSVRKFFNGSFLCVCDLKKSLGLINKAGSQMAYKKLDALHCVHWNEMSGDMKGHVLQVFALGMIYSPILEVMEGGLEEELKEAQTILQNILRPPRRRGNALGNNSQYFEGSVPSQETNLQPVQKKSIIDRILRR